MQGVSGSSPLRSTNMTTLQLLGVLSGIVTLIGYLTYFRDIFRGCTKPERASWFIWSILGIIAFSSQYAEGARASLWATAVQTLGIIVTFLLSFKYGTGGLARRDIVAVIVATIGLLAWYGTKQPVYALMLVILVDGAGMLPTLIKTYEEPRSETLFTWGCDCLAGLLAMIAVGSLNIILLAYPLYLFIANGAEIMVIILGSRRLARLKVAAD